MAISSMMVFVPLHVISYYVDADTINYSIGVSSLGQVKVIWQDLFPIMPVCYYIHSKWQILAVS